MSTVTVDGMIPMHPQMDNFEIYYKEDMKYVERGQRSLYLQIIGPIGMNHPVPCIVYIPGSAFHEQNVKERIPQLSYLAQRGFVVAALEYRGSECAPFPAQTLDAKAGVSFMREHAEEYGIHPENIILMGDSSGGHTALMAAFSYGIPALEEKGREINRPIVKGVIDLYGPTNFLTMNDELVPFGQSCQLYESLKKAKKDAIFYQVIGAHHGGREFWTKEVLDIEEQFIRRCCE